MPKEQCNGEEPLTSPPKAPAHTGSCSWLQEPVNHEMLRTEREQLAVEMGEGQLHQARRADTGLSLPEETLAFYQPSRMALASAEFSWSSCTVLCCAGESHPKLFSNSYRTASNQGSC